jgi:hypothetical protein
VGKKAKRRKCRTRDPAGVADADSPGRAAAPLSIRATKLIDLGVAPPAPPGFGRNPLSADQRRHWNFSEAMRLKRAQSAMGEMSQPCELPRAETAPQKYVSAGSSGPP